MEPLTSLISSGFLGLFPQLSLFIGGLYVYDFISSRRRGESEKLLDRMQVESARMQAEAVEFRKMQAETIEELKIKTQVLEKKVDELQAWKDSKTNSYIDQSFEKIDKISLETDKILAQVDEIKNLVKNKHKQ